MPSDGLDIEYRCILSAIGYLLRNDFSSICVMADRAIKARDGTRLVYVWVVIDDGVQGGAVIPEDLVSRALKDRARLDVIKFSTSGDKADIEHMMNAPIK